MCEAMVCSYPTVSRSSSELSSCGSIVRVLSFPPNHCLSAAMNRDDARDVLEGGAQDYAGPLRFAAAQHLIGEHLALGTGAPAPPPMRMPTNSNVRHFDHVAPMPPRRIALSPVTSKCATPKVATVDPSYSAFDVAAPATHLCHDATSSGNSSPRSHSLKQDASMDSASPQTEPKSSDVTLNLRFHPTLDSVHSDDGTSSSNSLRNGELNIAHPTHCNFEKPPSKPRPEKLVPTPSDYSFDSPSEIERDVPQMVRNRSGMLRFLVPRVVTRRSASMEVPIVEGALFAQKRASLPVVRENRMDSTASREERATLPPQRDGRHRRRRRMRDIFSALRFTRRSSYPVPDRTDRREFSLRSRLARSRASPAPSSLDNSLKKLPIVDAPTTPVVAVRGPVESKFPHTTLSPARAPLERPVRRVPLADRQPLHEWAELMPRSASSATLYGRGAPVARSSSGTTMRTVSMPKPPDTVPRRRAEIPRGMSAPLFRGRPQGGGAGGSADLRKVRMPGSGVETVVARLPVEAAGYDRHRRRKTIAEPPRRSALMYSR